MEKRRHGDLDRVLNVAISMAKSGSSQELVDYVAMVYPQYPDCLELAKLWYFGLCGMEERNAAAALTIRMVSDGYHVDQALVWLRDLRSFLLKYDDDLAEKAALLEGVAGHQVRLMLSLFHGNAVEAEHLFCEMHKRWPGKSSYGVLAFADDLFQQKCFSYSEKYYLEALESEPENLLLISRLVEIMLELEKARMHEKATEADNLAETMIRRFPDEPKSWFAMGLVRMSASRPDRAYPYYEKYLEVFPEDRHRSGFVFNLSYLDDMKKREVFKRRVDWCGVYSKLVSVESDLPLVDDLDPDRWLRIGFVSPDFGKHPVGFFCKSILEHHDSEKFEIFLYSQRNPVTDDDAVSREFRALVGEDHWRWLYATTPVKALDLVRRDRIDILVDLAGHSNMNRLDIFCNRGAPVQVEWLGFPGSTGLPEMDYRLSDEIIEPMGEADELSSERIVRMPNGFHCITFSDDLPKPSSPPCLENKFITFGSFNNCDKIGARTVALWARVLREIPQARLLLKHQTMEIFSNRESFKSLFAVEGVNPSRIQFEGTTVSRNDHFAYYEKMDVALDPVAYNGTTTTCEALYMGVPVLTLLGDSHPSRVSASLLHRMGMDGWVAKTEDEFVYIAKAAAARPDALAKRRASMRETYLNSALGDGPAMARDLEDAYRSMWREKCAERFSETNDNNQN